MSFVFADADQHSLPDILPGRRKRDLLKYFQHYSENARKNVKTVPMDMYAPYMDVVKDVFTHAQILLDRFHLFNHVGHAFAKTRIRIMNQCSRYSFDFRNRIFITDMFARPITKGREPSSLTVT